MAGKNRRIAVVLSGGGAKGAYAAGALGEIVKRVRKIDILTGASIGAINAAVFAVAYEKTGNAGQAAARVRESWKDTDNLFSFQLLRLLLQAAIGGVINGLSLEGFLSFCSLVSNSQICRRINQLIPDIRLSDLKSIDLSINATDLNSGKSVSFNRHNDAPLRQAVLASSCIPVVFPAVNIGRDYFVDGGVFNNTPLRDAMMLEATDVFIVSLKPKDKPTYQAAIRTEHSFDSVYDVGTRLLELIMDKIMYEDLKKARKVNKIVAAIKQLETTNPNSPALAQLKQAINYTKNGRMKAIVNFYEIAPHQRLEPPGTLGFDDHQAIHRIMAMGEKDARRQLLDVAL